MIRVSIDPQEMMFRLDGHAGYAPEGQDIVCAGASMLAAALFEYVMCRVDDDDLGACELQPGHAELDVAPANTDVMRDCRCAFHMAAMGFTLLAARYPEHIIMD